MSDSKETEEKLSPAEFEAKLAKLKRRFLRSFIASDLCLIIILLDRYTEFINIGITVPLILLVFTFLATIGYYGQYRTLEQKGN